MDFLDDLLKAEQLLMPIFVGIFGIIVWCNNQKNQIKTNKENIDRIERAVDPSLARIIEQRFDALEKKYDELHNDHTNLDEKVDGVSDKLSELIGKFDATHNNKSV